MVAPTYQDLYALGQKDPIARIKTMSDLESHGKEIPRGFRKHPKKHIPGKCDCGNDITSGYRCLDCFMEDKKGIPNPRKKRSYKTVDPYDLSGLGLGNIPIDTTIIDTFPSSTYPWLDIGTSTVGGGMAGSTQAKYSICGATTAFGTSTVSNHTFSTPLRKYK